MVVVRLVAIMAFAGALARPASAQIYETVGIRAQGMAGAFVAGADDSTATWWNPAGLATGAYFSGSVEHRSGQGANDEEGTLGVSLMVPSLGFSYYRGRVGPVRPVVFNPPDGGARIVSWPLTQLGVTTGQSLGEYLVVASTAKLVHAAEPRADLDVG